MKKTLLKTFIITTTASLLAGCGTVNALHDKLANMQLQKMQLHDGSTVYVDQNVPPTADWNCQELGTPQSFNWALIQAEGQFYIKGQALGLLSKKAIDAAAQQGIRPNYINLQLPNEYNFVSGNEKQQTYTNLNPGANAVASYYQCQHINPNHHLGSRRKVNVGVFSGGNAADLISR